jgi:regulatory protein
VVAGTVRRRAPGVSRGRASRAAPPAERPENGGQRARSAALALLARRDYSEEQLRRALRAKEHAEADVADAIESLRAQRYLDDASLATRYARSRMEFRGQGQYRIRQGLRQRGLGSAIIEEGIREAAAEVSEADVLDRQARRYWAQRQKLAPARRLQNLWAFLLRRGFPVALVHERLHALWPRWSDALAGLDARVEEE